MPRLTLSGTPAKLIEGYVNPYTFGMEVDFTPEQLASLSQIASYHGTNAGQLVKDAALRVLEEDRRFSKQSIAGSSRRMGESSSRKKRWTLALPECSSPDASAVAAASRGRSGEDQDLPYRTSISIYKVDHSESLRRNSFSQGIAVSRQNWI